MAFLVWRTHNFIAKHCRVLCLGPKCTIGLLIAVPKGSGHAKSCKAYCATRIILEYFLVPSVQHEMWFEEFLFYVYIFSILHKPFSIADMQFLRVNNGAVELDSSVMGAQQEGKKIKVPLNSR